MSSVKEAKKSFQSRPYIYFHLFSLTIDDIAPGSVCVYTYAFVVIKANGSGIKFHNLKYFPSLIYNHEQSAE